METQKPLLKDGDGKEVDVHMYRLVAYTDKIILEQAWDRSQTNNRTRKRRKKLIANVGVANPYWDRGMLSADGDGSTQKLLERDWILDTRGGRYSGVSTLGAEERHMLNATVRVGERITRGCVFLWGLKPERREESDGVWGGGLHCPAEDANIQCARVRRESAGGRTISVSAKPRAMWDGE
ncbi:hypothetical protein Tco_1420371 [Tanacetum coccineum]